MLRASDIMSRKVISVPPDMSVLDLGRVFMDNDVSGVPVIDASGTLVGIVTENDLISRNKRLHLPTVLRLFDAFIPLEGMEAVEREIRKMSASVVRDICTTDVAALDEDTSIEDIATIMTERGRHHLPVVKDGRVVGMIGKHEVIRGLAREGANQ